MKKHILAHYNNYPAATLQDLFKFLHQSEFGPGHFIANPDENFKYLQAEFKSISNMKKDKICDDLLNEFCRLHLQVLQQTTLSITTFQKFFEQSAKVNTGNLDAYWQKINLLADMCACGELPFDQTEVAAFKSRIINEPMKPFRHSDAFRLAYYPAYRVINKKFFNFLPLFAAIDQLMATQEKVIVAIDGDCAAGKTSLSQLISQIYDCNQVHMDHFFLQPDQQTEIRLNTPGENIDHERFTKDVMTPLMASESLSYKPFNCMTQTFGEAISLPFKKLTIIEGSYALHASLIQFYDLKVFLQIPQDVQLDRILARDGINMLQKFKDVWIPMEKNYAKTFNVKEKCDFCFDYLADS